MKAAMQNFTQKIVSMMKEEKLFQTQGGPIILSQVYKQNIKLLLFILAQIGFQIWIHWIVVQDTYL